MAKNLDNMIQHNFRALRIAPQLDLIMFFQLYLKTAGLKLTGFISCPSYLYIN